MPESMPDRLSLPIGPCCVSTSIQSYPLKASCSATVGLCELRNRPSLGDPARSCFLKSAPLRRSLMSNISCKRTGKYTEARGWGLGASGQGLGQLSFDPFELPADVFHDVAGFEVVGEDVPRVGFDLE